MCEYIEGHKLDPQLYIDYKTYTYSMWKFDTYSDNFIDGVNMGVIPPLAYYYTTCNLNGGSRDGIVLNKEGVEIARTMVGAKYLPTIPVNVL